MTLKVTLTDEMGAFVERLLASGRYVHAGEVMRDALRLLADRESADERLRADVMAKVAAGLKSLDEDRGLPADEVFAQLGVRGASGAGKAAVE